MGRLLHLPYISIVLRHCHQAGAFTHRFLEFLVRPHGVFNGGYLSAPLAVVKVLKKLDLRCVQAATAFTGGPVERTGPDFRQVSGSRRKASKFRKRAAGASLTRVGVAAGRQPPRRIRACGSALAVSRGAGDLNEVEPAQQSSAAALPHGPQAIDHLKIAEQGLTSWNMRTYVAAATKWPARTSSLPPRPPSAG